ncbi:hypothetical protein ACS0TY_025255 [Phlomoides rotata]
MWRAEHSNANSGGSSTNIRVKPATKMCCYCGYQLHVCTSTTIRNLGQRFISCPVRGVRISIANESFRNLHNCICVTYKLIYVSLVYFCIVG